jgi:N-acetylglucosaminyl-diphospho-decaprenol L-rhamnosyltransferase
MRIAAVIVNYRTPDLVLRCLNALASERSAFPDLQAVVTDNASGDGSAERLSFALEQPPFADWVEFLPLLLNGGFGWGNNQAIFHLLDSASPPDAIFFLNPDTIIERGALAALVADMGRRGDAGAIGSQLLNEDGSLSGSAFRFPSVAREFTRGLRIGAVERLLRIKPMLIPYGISQPVDWVTGASVLIRTFAIRTAGMFDTGFFLYFEEVELMRRLKRHGWQTYHCPDSRVIHIAGASTGVIGGKMRDNRSPPDYFFKSRHRYFALTGGRLRALLADLAWLTGSILAGALEPIMRRNRNSGDHAERKALLRIGVGGRPLDAEPAITYPHDKPGEPPAWMSS